MPDASQPLARPATVAIISKPGRPELSDILPKLHQFLTQRGYKVVVDPESAEYFRSADVVTRGEIGSRSPALVLVLGGDGTLLSARAVCRWNL
jgi:NAD+ kinase